MILGHKAKVNDIDDYEKQGPLHRLCEFSSLHWTW